MYRYRNLQKPDVKKVQSLVNKYLLPSYYKRLQITKDDITPEITELEPVFAKDYVDDVEKYHGKYSIVCENTDGKLVAALLNSYYTENEFQYQSLTRYEKMLQKPMEYPGLTKEYIQLIVDLYKHLDLFKRMEAKNVLVLFSAITKPSYRGKSILVKMVEQAEKTVNKGDILLIEMMRPYKSTISEAIKFDVWREIQSTGGFVHTVGIKQVL